MSIAFSYFCLIWYRSIRRKGKAQSVLALGEMKRPEVQPVLALGEMKRPEVQPVMALGEMYLKYSQSWHWERCT